MDNYSRVRLLTDRYAKRYGVAVGAIGFIVEVYGDEAYEVDFSWPEGTSTVSTFSVKQNEVELAAAPSDAAQVDSS